MTLIIFCSIITITPRGTFNHQTFVKMFLIEKMSATINFKRMLECNLILELIRVSWRYLIVTL